MTELRACPAHAPSAKLSFVPDATKMLNKQPRTRKSIRTEVQIQHDVLNTQTPVKMAFSSLTTHVPFSGLTGLL